MCPWCLLSRGHQSRVTASRAQWHPSRAPHGMLWCRDVASWYSKNICILTPKYFFCTILPQLPEITFITNRVKSKSKVINFNKIDEQLSTKITKILIYFSVNKYPTLIFLLVLKQITCIKNLSNHIILQYSRKNVLQSDEWMKFHNYLKLINSLFKSLFPSYLKNNLYLMSIINCSQIIQEDITQKVPYPLNTCKTHRISLNVVCDWLLILHHQTNKRFLKAIQSRRISINSIYYNNYS